MKVDISKQELRDALAFAEYNNKDIITLTIGNTQVTNQTTYYVSVDTYAKVTCITDLNRLIYES